MALFKEVMPDLQFGHFNILEDEEVRQGIKGFLMLYASASISTKLQSIPIGQLFHNCISKVIWLVV